MSSEVLQMASNLLEMTSESSLGGPLAGSRMLQIASQTLLMASWLFQVATWALQSSNGPSGAPISLLGTQYGLSEVPTASGHFNIFSGTPNGLSVLGAPNGVSGAPDGLYYALYGLFSTPTDLSYHSNGLSGGPNDPSALCILLQQAEKKMGYGQTDGWTDVVAYDALQDKKDKVTQKHQCKKFLEYSINKINMLYN